MNMKARRYRQSSTFRKGARYEEEHIHSRGLAIDPVPADPRRHKGPAAAKMTAPAAAESTSREGSPPGKPLAAPGASAAKAAGNTPAANPKSVRNQPCKRKNARTRNLPAQGAGVFAREDSAPFSMTSTCRLIFRPAVWAQEKLRQQSARSKRRL